MKFANKNHVTHMRTTCKNMNENNPKLNQTKKKKNIAQAEIFYTSSAIGSYQ